MKLIDTRFGDIDYEETDVLVFEEGLIGFPDMTQFVVLCPRPDSKFRWLQSLHQPKLAFLVTDVNQFVQDYSPVVSDAVVSKLGLDADEEVPRIVFATVNIPRGHPEEMTLNLAGPLVVNLRDRKGKQIVIEDGAYTTRYKVFQTSEKEGGVIAA